MKIKLDSFFNNYIQLQSWTRCCRNKSKIGVSLECFAVEFLEVSRTTVEIWLLGNRLGTCYQFQAFQGFC